MILQQPFAITTGGGINGFFFRSPETVQTGQVPSTQTDFPILINVTDARFKSTGNGGNVQSSSGFDIRPYSDTALTSALTYELERYNASTGEVVMWVKRSSLADGNITYLAYGNTTLTTDGSDGPNTFSNSFKDVYHLKDGTTLSVASSAGSPHNGTNHSATAGAGQVDGAASFVSASSQYIDLGNYSFASPITLSAWVNGTSFPGAYNTVLLNNNANSVFDGILVKSTGKVAWLCSLGGVGQDGTGSHTLSTGTWAYLVFVYDTTNGLACYVNGASDVTHAQNGSISSTAQTDIGRDNVNAGRFWNGALDEVRIATTNRTANWITTEYNNQSAPGTFSVLGTEVAL